MPTAIGFFNNKGGVGKTTLACNFAAYLAMERELSVVVVDCDPQANATQLLLSDEDWTATYEDRSLAGDRTILKALQHIRDGDSIVDTDLEFHRSERFGVNVVAGHPFLSGVEDLLSTSWGEYLTGLPGGARRSLWARQLTKGRSHISSDVIVFDMGPSLGALNRSVLMGCDFFVTPVAADLFSLYALENIGDWTRTWARDYQRGFQALVEKQHDPTRFDIPNELPVISGWAGYTVQQYVAKSSGGKLRGVQSYERYSAQIPERAESLRGFAPKNSVDLALGVVPNMFSMIPLAQAAHSSIFDLRPGDGVRGAQVSQRLRYVEQLGRVFERLASNIGLQ